MRKKLITILSLAIVLCCIFTTKINAEVTYDLINYSEDDLNYIGNIAYPVSFAVYDQNDTKLSGVQIQYSYNWENEYGFDIHISNETYRSIRSNNRENYELHVTYKNGVTVNHGPLYRNAYQKEETEDKIMKYSPEGANYKELYYVIIDRDIYDVSVGFDNKTISFNDYSEENGRVIWTPNFRSNSEETINAFKQYIEDPDNDFTITYKKKRIDNSTVSKERKDFSVDNENGNLYLNYEENGESGTFVIENNGGGEGSEGYEYDQNKSDVTVIIDKDTEGRYTVNAYKGETIISTIYGDTWSARDALIGSINYLQGYVKSKILLQTDLIWNSNIGEDNDISLDHSYIKGWQINFDQMENTNNGLDIDLNGHNISGFRLSVPGSWAFIYLTNSSQNGDSNIVFNSGDPAITNSGNIFLLGKVNVSNEDGAGIAIHLGAEKTYLNKDASVDAKIGISFENAGTSAESDMYSALTVLGTVKASSVGISFNVIDDNPKHGYKIELDGSEQAHSKLISSGTGISVTGKPEVMISNHDMVAKNAFVIKGGTYNIVGSKISSNDGPLFSVDTDSGDSRETDITIKADSGVELIASDYIVSASALNQMIKKISFYSETSEVSNGFIQYGTGLVQNVNTDSVSVRGGCYSKNDIKDYLADPALSVVQSNKYPGFYTVVIPNPQEDVTDYDSLKIALQSSIITTINVKNDIAGTSDIVFDCDVSKRINLNNHKISGFALKANTDEVKQYGDDNSLNIYNGTLENNSGTVLDIDGPRVFLDNVTVNASGDAIIMRNGELNTSNQNIITGNRGVVIDENEEKNGHSVSLNLDNVKIKTTGSAVSTIHTTDKHHTYIWLKNCNIGITSTEEPILNIKDNTVIEIDTSSLSGGSCGVYFGDENIKKIGDNYYSRLRIMNGTSINSKTGLRLAKEVEFEAYDLIIQAVNNVIEAYDGTHVLIASGFYSSQNGEIIVLIDEKTQIQERTILSGYYSHYIDDYIVNGQRNGFSYVCKNISDTGTYKYRVMRQYGTNVFFNSQYIGNYGDEYFTRDINTDVDLLSKALKNLDSDDAVILSVEDARNNEGIDSFPEGVYADYFDIYLNRTTQQLEEADNYVVVKISYDNADNLKIYHKHGDIIIPIKKVSPSYGKSLIEECYYVENSAIYIVIRKFSLFGISDTGESVPYENRTSTPEYVIPKTGIAE